MTNESGPLRLAVLIDADNTSYKLADGLFAKIREIGDPRVRRVYGDFSSPLATGWNAAVARHAMVPQQQFPYVPGKNATDITLVIDAMDLLHGGGFDGFCLVSSDSDFTRLATRIREHGLLAFGFGQKNASQSFQWACSEFFKTESLLPASPPPKPVQQSAAQKTVPAVAKSAPAAKPKLPESMDQAERILIAAIGDNDAEWVTLSAIGIRLHKLAPNFDVRKYSVRTLTDLVRKTSCFDLDERGGSMKVRRKPQAAVGTAVVA